MSLGRRTAGAHAAYPTRERRVAVDRTSFERVTRRKQDFWLVRTVGGLAAAIGLSLGLAALRGTKRPETVALALSSGLAFGVADVRASRTESRIYLADLRTPSAVHGRVVAPLVDPGGLQLATSTCADASLTFVRSHFHRRSAS